MSHESSVNLLGTMAVIHSGWKQNKLLYW